MIFMLFKIVDDWKQFLPPEDEKRLNDVLRSVAKHRNAYRASKDVKVAQLWCAYLELAKQNQLLYRKLKRMEFIFEGIAERMKMEETTEKEIIEALEKF